MKTKAWLLALMLGVSALCHAHEDVALKLAADGTVQGLPAAYSPARLSLVFSAIGDEHRITSLRLQIGKQHVQLPACLLGLIRTQSAQDLALSASWDHDETVVPHYLQLQLLDAGHPVRFALLFNLHTARVIDMTAHVERSEDEVQSIPVDVRSRCSTDELRDVVQSGRSVMLRRQRRIQIAGTPMQEHPRQA